MKKILSILSLFTCWSLAAQETIYPAPAQKKQLFITNATVHTGNGEVLENTSIKIINGKIADIGKALPMPLSLGNIDIIDAKGKHVYPGLILPTSQLGIKEIGGNAVRGSNDYLELGELNTNIRTIAAYNADSKIIRTVLSNGILLAHIVPSGSFVAGTSSVVQLDAWNYEDAAYKADNGIHFYMPSLLARPGGGRFGGFGGGAAAPTDPVKEALDRVETVRSFLRQAKAYNQRESKEVNLKLEAVKGLFEKKQKMFIHCNQVKQMLLAIDFVKEFGIDVVIVGGIESWQIADLLKQNNISVILSQMHNLPTLDDDDVDQPFKTPAVLQKAGVLFCINDDDEQNRGRNLSFNAGTAATYGLSKEEALQAVTLNTAKVLGIDDVTGSIEKGKDANIIISEGDILDMRSNNITHAFIQGRQVSLDNKHKQLYERYKHKYDIK